MLKRSLLWILLAGMLVVPYAEIYAGGISVDAGLTPAQDKWILRTQLRYMQRINDPTPMKREMESFMFPMVVAYGVRPDLTLMIRQPFVRMNMTMGTTTSHENGLADLFVLAKYRAFRRNTPNYTIGIAPLLALEFPTGKEPFTSDAWDLKTGVFISGRSGPWGSDWNLTYTLNGVAGDDDRVRSEVIDVVAAFAHQITIGEEARTAFAPVVEVAYNNVTADRIEDAKQANSGESYFMVSPGAKLTISSIILEALLRIPVWQNQIGIQTEMGVGVLFGIRVML
jgi:hypothetical protein